MAKTYFIDIYPEFNTWNDWHSNVGYVLAEQNLPFVEDEAEWHEFAKAFAEAPAFATYGLPEHDAYPTWQEWAKDLLVAINGSTIT